MSNSALFFVVLVTAVFMVLAALYLAVWMAPKSTNALKGEPYECGIQTRGPSWAQFKVGYYLIAILFLVFDVETVLLFPWATIFKSVGVDGLILVSFFIIILALGLVYAWKKGALEWK
ncbi:MAG: NADH-quinone oxidoreductase subunit A [Dysgonamonadaceae bacterium]|jgi:NADH-quinone oxidoreductase subunit A|nr:NADH-quinone oxidoreductase subunit A [Dysgonamonadaceae bacterium]